MKKAIKKGEITVDGQAASTATFIRGGETIQYNGSTTSAKHKPLELALDVLYEDQHLAAILKPAGILVSGNSFKTIANALPQNLRGSSLKDAATPQPVHRLDYATTGVLLVGKTHSAIRALNALFAEKAVAKTYCAITIGEMKTNGVITTEVDQKPAETAFSVIANVESKRFGLLNLVELKPRTGRRHQIRKHLAGQGNPILGDQLYGLEGLILKGKSLFLHALSVGFEHPFTREKLLVKAEPPAKFLKIFPGNPFLNC